MKNFFLILLLLVLFKPSYSQEEVRLSFSGNSILSPNFSAYSINPGIDIRVKDWLNVHYSLGFGIRGNKKFYMHMPATAPLGMLAFIAGLGNGGEFWTIAGIILLVIPEGVSFDITLNDKWELSPFININSAETFTSGSTNEFNYHLSADAGLGTRFYFSDKLFAHAYSSMKIIESKGLGVSGGLGLGLSW